MMKSQQRSSQSEDLACVRNISCIYSMLQYGYSTMNNKFTAPAKHIHFEGCIRTFVANVQCSLPLQILRRGIVKATDISSRGAVIDIVVVDGLWRGCMAVLWWWIKQPTAKTKTKTVSATEHFLQNVFDWESTSKLLWLLHLPLKTILTKLTLLFCTIDITCYDCSRLIIKSTLGFGNDG